jgi:hypothetical protein
VFIENLPPSEMPGENEAIKCIDDPGAKIRAGPIIFPSPRRRRWWKITLLFFAGFLAPQSGKSALVRTIFLFPGCREDLDQSLALADTGRLITAGNPFFRRIPSRPAGQLSGGGAVVVDA